ncbi:MAG: right-handed parallel beta-helix repeat-containing protein, partial [Planctomycetota bacterium]
NFGNYELASKSGYKHEDVDGSGDLTVADVPVEGWEIILTGTDGAGNPVLVVAYTDASGYYEFTGLVPGSYTVTETVAPGWVAVSATSINFDLVSGESETDNNFLNYRPALKSGYKFEDLDADGQSREAGEPGLGGWRIFVDYDDDGVLDAGEPSAVTAADGSYLITGIVPGTWKVQEVAQAGWTQSYPASGYHEETFTSGATLTDNDFGNWQEGSIHGYKFEDINGNGMDDIEPRLEGWVIELYLDDGDGSFEPFGDDALISAQVTGADGSYEFTGLEPGDYWVREVLQSEWIQTTPDPGLTMVLSGTHVTDLAFGNSPVGEDLFYVDDDAPGDPCHGNPDLSDPNENGTADHPFDAIQEAIDEASGGDTIMVLDGIYSGAGNRDIDLLGRAITVRSENGPDSCIIDCNGSEAEPHRGFHFSENEDGNSVLSGFMVIGGCGYEGAAILCENSSPTVSNCIFSGNSARGQAGGGVYCSSSSPTLTNCTFSGNSAYEGGGMRNSDSSPTLTDCTFSNNSADFQGGGMHNTSSSPTVNKCTFSGNSAKYGGGVFNNHSSPIVTNCTFSGNRASHFQGGGMCNDSGSPIVMNCKFIGNLAAKRGGGIANKNSDPNVINCIFSSNSANTRGGGMTNESGSDSSVTNCTFNGNSATSYGGGMYSDASNPIITNCIFWDNNVVGPATITYSNVQGGWPGLGNIDADPCFVEPGYWADANDSNVAV